ncbi:hypothetical protein [Bradyrhizobium sp.]
MNHLFYGFAIALACGLASSGAVWFLTPSALKAYLDAYFVSFNCLIAGGLIIGTAIFVERTQQSIPSFVEESFDPTALSKTTFQIQKGRFLSLRRSVTFSSMFIIAGFIIFYFCKFPFTGLPEYLLIVFACAQYGLGVYVGRKLFYVAQMLNSVEEIQLTTNIFKDDALGHIISYVNILSTLTIIFVYVHVTSYYHGPFQLDPVYGSSLRVALMLPAIIAAPVLVIFNFYPRAVLRRLYSRSINDQVGRLTDRLKNQNLSDFERMSCAIEYDKLWKEELRNRLRLSLSDLPIGITIVIMIVGLIIKR